MHGPAQACVNTMVNVSFMGKLNVASWGLCLGAVGQAGLCGNLLPHFPLWAIMAPLYVPWLTVFTISFCKVPPFGPRPFRNCLLFAICWYVAVTAIAEAFFLILPAAPQGHFPLVAARAITYVGALSFFVLIPAYVSLRRFDFT